MPLMHITEQSVADELTSIREANAAIERQVEELKRDAERLDYLEKDGGKTVQNVIDKWYWRTGWGTPHRRAESIRAAIDAALSGAGQGGKG